MSDNVELDTSTDESESSAPEIDPEIEREAREGGWVPKEQFRGDPKDHVDMETFVRRGREINPILRKNNERLKKEIDETRKALKEQELTIAEFRAEFSKMKESAYKRALADLKAERREALKEGDYESADALDEQIDEYKAQIAKTVEKPAESKPAAPDNSEFQEWHAENKWYDGNDEDLNDHTLVIGERIRRKNPSLVGRPFLDEVARQVKERFPEKFSNKKRETGSAVSGSSSRAESGGTRSFGALPREAKEACDNFIKQGLVKSREEYVANYDWE